MYGTDYSYIFMKEKREAERSGTRPDRIFRVEDGGGGGSTGVSPPQGGMLVRGYEVSIMSFPYCPIVHTMNITDHISESVETFFRVKIL
jgi:hypothetical protein